MSAWNPAGINGDDEMHAVEDGGEVTFCGEQVSYQAGAGEPTCKPCAAAAWALDQKAGESAEEALQESIGVRTLPDDHTRALALTITVAEFRELMRAAMYRVGELGTRHAAVVLEGAANKLGAAWNAAEEDETPTVCAAAECGRTRPRWTMEEVGGALVCSPKNAMHCGRCCQPGVYLTHYTEEEHQHQDDAPGTATVRAAASLVLRSEFTNWQDYTGPRSRAMTKAQRTQLETKLSAYRESLGLAMEAEGVPGPLEEFLEELSAWNVNQGFSNWCYDRHDRTLHGIRKAGH